MYKEDQLIWETFSEEDILKSLHIIKTNFGKEEKETEHRYGAKMPPDVMHVLLNLGLFYETTNGVAAKPPIDVGVWQSGADYWLYPPDTRGLIAIPASMWPKFLHELSKIKELYDEYKNSLETPNKLNIDV